MSNIVEKIHTIPTVLFIGSCTDEQIAEAESQLKLSFPDEYRDYIKQFGAISFSGTEWTGLNVTGYLNVVTQTLNERELNSDFPEECFVLENLGIDGVLIICDESGQIYLYRNNQKTIISKSLSEYLDMCLAIEQDSADENNADEVMPNEDQSEKYN